ncbi:hypothetical protein ACQP25_35945 [Microtetraspora malaysiensis]|uniref:hypothetical protein n=1 Tax=Microtetraspora malaysiensis TaxID=161358 RepID=UPI003D8A8335
MDDIAVNGANSAGSPRYVLVSDDDATDVWGTCLEIKNLFAAFDDPDAEDEWRTLELLGWSPDGSLRKYRDTAGDGPRPFGNAWIHVLDYEGRRIGSFWSPSMEVLEWRPYAGEPDASRCDRGGRVPFFAVPGG